MAGRKVSGVGVDLISLDRIQRLLEPSHGFSPGRLLSQAEMREWQDGGKDPVYFARLWAAKEAAFKAHDRDWLGPDGFQAIDIEIEKSGDRFRLRDAEESEGSFFGGEGWIGARMILWERQCAG